MGCDSHMAVDDLCLPCVSRRMATVRERMDAVQRRRVNNMTKCKLNCHEYNVYSRCEDCSMTTTYQYNTTLSFPTLPEPSTDPLIGRTVGSGVFGYTDLLHTQPADELTDHEILCELAEYLGLPRPE